MAKHSDPLDAASPALTCERCGLHPATMEYVDEDVTPRLDIRICGDCSDAFGGRHVLSWLAELQVPGFPSSMYPDIKDIASVTDDQARKVYRNWCLANMPGAHDNDPGPAA